MERICNRDCFHCPFEDCICDEMDHSDYREARRRDRDLTVSVSEKELARRKRYYAEHRETLLAYMQNYRHTHRDEIHAKRKIRYQKNKEEAKAYAKAYYAANRDRVNERRREARRKKKEALLHEKTERILY